MKRIGLLGGMSWESSVEYERIINTEVRRRLGGLRSADLLVRSFDFAQIEELQARGDWDTAGMLLAEAAMALERGGCETVLLCTNTMHKVYDAIAAAIRVPLLHIADATGAAVRQAGIGTVALLGTSYTMEQPFYRDRLARSFGLDVRVPGALDRETVHSVIYRELVRGVVSPDSKQRYLDVIARLVAQGCEGVIAGCTEIELLVGPDDLTVPYFPSMRLHALAAVEAALPAT